MRLPGEPLRRSVSGRAHRRDPGVLRRAAPARQDRCGVRAADGREPRAERGDRPRRRAAAAPDTIPVRGVRDLRAADRRQRADRRTRAACAARRDLPYRSRVRPHPFDYPLPDRDQDSSARTGTSSSRSRINRRTRAGSGWPTTICSPGCRARAARRHRDGERARRRISSARTRRVARHRRRARRNGRCLFRCCRRPTRPRRRPAQMDRVPRPRGGARGGRARDRTRTGRAQNAPRLERTAVVFQRPLPYLYLARQVFPDARVPYQALDALPLAAEPFAAALDQISRSPSRKAPARPWWSSCPRRTGGSRLMGMWSRDRTWRPPTECCATSSMSGDGIAFRRLRSSPTARDRMKRVGRASTALRAAAAAGAELRAMVDAPSASQQVSALLSFVAAHEVLPQASRRVAREPPSRPRGDSGGAPVAPRRASPARRRTGSDRRAVRHRSPMDRGPDVLSAHRQPWTDAPRCAGRRLRGCRRAAARRPRRKRLARSRPPQHLLPLVAADPARMAFRLRSPGGGPRPLPRSVDARENPRRGLTVHARGRRDRAGVAVSRGARGSGFTDRAHDDAPGGPSLRP